MTPLEQRYRRLLRLLPAGYREQREEEMVDTFLLSTRTGDPVDDEVVDQVGRPGLAERASVLWLAVRLRLEGDTPPSPARREGLRGAARWWVTSGFVIHAVGSLWLLLWLAYARVDGTMPNDGAWQVSERDWLVFGLQLLWLPACVALLWGRVRVARALGVAALCVGVFRAVSGLAVWGLSGSGLTLLMGWVVVAVDVALVCGVGAFEPGTPSPQRRGWCLAGGGLVLVPVVGAVTTLALSAPLALWGDYSLWSWASLGAALVVWRSLSEVSAEVKVSLLGGLALLCLTAAVLMVWPVIASLHHDWAAVGPWLPWVTLLQLLLPAAIGGIAASAAARHLRQLEIAPSP